MADLRMYAILDGKAGFFSQPFFCAAAVHALRIMERLVSDPDSMLSRHPADFSLYEIGTWDDQTGRVWQPESYNFLGAATQFIRAAPSAPLFDKE